MSDITTLKRALERNAGSIAEHLLPRGHREGREWCAGSVQGEPGQSLKVCIQGAKSGVWSDFAEGGDGGDLIDLWCAVKRLQLPEALDDIRAFLGVEKPAFERSERSYKRPPPPRAAAPKSAVRQYLIGERKLSDAALAAYRIGEQERTIVFPSFVEGELLFIKYLGIDRPAGKKVTRVEADCEPVLFGWQAIDRNARELVITEGEIDALSLFDYGHPAVSVPFGGGKGAKQRWIESEFDRLLRFEVIYLALDLDEEGEAGAVEIANRLGRHRCRRVKLPRKDANECLKAGVAKEAIDKAIADAQTLDPPELRRAGSYTDAVIRLFWPPEGQEPGYQLPFAKLGRKLLFRPGEMTIWTGATGEGKSQILGHAAVDWGRQGARVCMASLETRPAQFLRYMAKQAGNADRPPEPFGRKIMAWLDEWLWIFDVVGKCAPAKIIEIFEYARARYGCDVFIGDSLMRMGIGSEDYEAQEAAVAQMVTWALEKGVHLHLVAHSRKGSTDGRGVPENEDVKGASEIASNAMNIVSVWRNRKLEAEVQQAADSAEKGDHGANDRLKGLLEKPPVILNVAKQRNGDWEGKVGLWFNRETHQYRSSQDDPRGWLYVPYQRMAGAAE